jgi:hypothetical protein
VVFTTPVAPLTAAFVTPAATVPTFFAVPGCGFGAGLTGVVFLITGAACLDSTDFAAEVFDCGPWRSTKTSSSSFDFFVVAADELLAFCGVVSVVLVSFLGRFLSGVASLPSLAPFGGTLAVPVGLLAVDLLAGDLGVTLGATDFLGSSLLPTGLVTAAFAVVVVVEVDGVDFLVSVTFLGMVADDDIFSRVVKMIQIQEFKYINMIKKRSRFVSNSGKLCSYKAEILILKYYVTFHWWSSTA